MSNNNLDCIYSGDANERLDKILAEQLPSQSRSQLKKAIEAGQVEVNEIVITKAGALVRPGDSIHYEPQELTSATLTPYEFPLTIPYEDEHLLVVDKPAGLVVHPGAGVREKTLANALVAHLSSLEKNFSGSDRPGIVHRLDKDTTGLLVVAKDKNTHQALAEQFSKRTITREYRALVLSTPRKRKEIDSQEEGEIALAIGRDPKNRLRMAVVAEGKEAITTWSVLKRMDHATLLSLRLKTGRTHQIRVHLDAVGCPLIGDPLYGDLSNLPNSYLEYSVQFGRQALHAAELGFEHPHSKEHLQFQSELPEDFAELIKRFEA